METNYEWKTTLFSSKFEIYNNGILTGELNKGNWKTKVPGELNNRKIVFDTKGFFRHNTSIIDLNDNSTIATIIFSGWKSQASINYRNRIYSCQFDNFVRTKWSITNENGTIVKFWSGPIKGTINSFSGDEILILSGFFIRNFIRQRTAGIAAST
jgi:hypothetical protein